MLSGRVLNCRLTNRLIRSDSLLSGSATLTP
jgi:hypothetical protein